MRKIIAIGFLFLFSFSLISAQEATILQDETTILKAKVVNVVSEEEKVVPGTELQTTYQTLEVEILEGEKKGSRVTLIDDYLKLDTGDTFYLLETIRAEDDVVLYSTYDYYRMPWLIFFTVLFILLVLSIGGIQGIRGLLSLAGSLLLIVYVLIPGIMGGYSPILVSVFVSSLIIILGSYVTHGFNKTTSSAVIGMIITVVLTGILAYWSVGVTKLTGFANDEAVYLNLSTQGSIDIVGILLSGIMIGLLGVLYDVAIGQAISVEELHRIAPHISRRKIYSRALRMGREHIGALVNTLAIAYVGASLPLLLLFSLSESTTFSVMNREIFATEIIRTLIGSIGLVLAVPISTLLAVWIIVKVKEGEKDNILEEERALEHVGHKH